jgi:Family of unknown function (DUF6152)
LNLGTTGEGPMKTRLVAGCLLAGVLAVCLPMFAHHGSQAYDQKEVILKDATVTELVWANPHTIIQFDAKDANGKVAHWAGELGSPSALGLVGWNRASVKKGDVITVYIHQSKTGNTVGRIEYILLADGSKLTDSGGAAAGGGGRGGRGGGAEY